MSRIKVEALGEEIVIEYDRASIVKMEEMGYNALDPTSKMYTNYEIMIYGGLLKHRPKTTWKEATEIASELNENYGMKEILEAISPMIQDVFFPGGIEKTKKKKIVFENSKTLKA